MSRGWKGSEVIGAPQLAQVHSPVNFGFSPGGAEAEVSRPANASSAGIGSPASCDSSKSGASSIGGGSLAIGISGTGCSDFSASLPLA